MSFTNEDKTGVGAALMGRDLFGQVNLTDFPPGVKSYDALYGLEDSSIFSDREIRIRNRFNTGWFCP